MQFFVHSCAEVDKISTDVARRVGRDIGASYLSFLMLWSHLIS